jgi:hypothetical protein
LLGTTTGAIKQAVTAADIENLYKNIIGSTADKAGMDHWLGEAAKGMDLATMEGEFRKAMTNADLISQRAALIKSGASTSVLGATTGVTNQAVTAADIANLYKNITGSTADKAGLDHWLGEAAKGMDLATMEAEFRKAMTNPALVAERAKLIKSGASTSVPGTSMPSGFAGFQQGIRDVPFGATVVGQNVTGPNSGYTAAMYAPSIQDAFLRSMQYQSQLPNMLPVFNPAATPSIFPQIAQSLGRYNIAGAEVPAWMRVNTPEEAANLAAGKPAVAATVATSSGD